MVSHACVAAGVDRTTAYQARTIDEGFAKAWTDALEDGIDRAEQEAFRRAVVGFDEPVIHRGKLMFVKGADGKRVPLTTRRHSDQLLALILRARRKTVYAERTELTGADGGPIKTTPEGMERAVRIAALVALAKSRMDGDALETPEGSQSAAATRR